MIYSKLPLDYSEILDLLVSRGLIISDRNKAIECLKVVSYFRLDNYFHPMESDKIRHIFKSGSTFDLLTSKLLKPWLNALIPKLSPLATMRWMFLDFLHRFRWIVFSSQMESRAEYQCQGIDLSHLRIRLHATWLLRTDLPCWLILL